MIDDIKDRIRLVLNTLFTSDVVGDLCKEIERLKTGNVYLLTQLDICKAENAKLRLHLRAADAMAKVADDWVERKVIGSRSALADARLDYGEFKTYLWGYDSAAHPADAILQAARFLEGWK